MVRKASNAPDIFPSSLSMLVCSSYLLRVPLLVATVKLGSLEQWVGYSSDDEVKSVSCCYPFPVHYICMNPVN
jgi:hypothetical protein